MACNGSSISLAHSCHQSARDQEVCTTYPEDSRKTLQCQVTAGVRWDEQVQQCCLSKQTSKSLVWRGKKKKKNKKNQTGLSSYRTKSFNYSRGKGRIYACNLDCRVCRCWPRTTTLLLPWAPVSHRGQAWGSNSLENSAVRQPYK